MSVTISFDGLERFLAVTDDRRLLGEVDRAMARAAATLRDAAKKMPPVSAKTTGLAALGIPVDTGSLRQRIKSQKVAPFTYDVYGDTEYAGYVHDGTSKVPARPFFGWLLNNFRGRETIDVILRTTLENFATP